MHIRIGTYIVHAYATILSILHQNTKLLYANQGVNAAVDTIIEYALYLDKSNE